MDIIHDITTLRRRLADAVPIAFVPTMGNLHAGHIDLTRIARERVAAANPNADNPNADNPNADNPNAGNRNARGCVVVSIFVNRLQFGPKEDFDKYPRTLAEDCTKCRDAGVDVIFAPDERELYPVPQTYFVEPPDIQHILDGAIRPGHFRGVATVVMKLFNIVKPQVAVFGRKDYQQCRVLDNMVREFNLPIAMIFADTVRAEDGLALSSRNGYLTVAERVEAPQLFAALSVIRVALQHGRRDFATLETSAVETLKMRGWMPDYISIRRQADLLPPNLADSALVIVAAARLGATRLIDNLEVSL
jgi:pantoate--beta-alanine ligase